MNLDNPLKVRLVHSSSEREAAEAVPIETRKMGGRKIGQAMQAEMDLLLQSSKRSGQATLISAPPGAGKTYFLVNQLFPAAAARELTVLFVSSRVAINLQQKRALAKAIGQEELLNNLTAQGLQQQEQIGNVTIVTYQRLFQMFRDPEGAAKLASVNLFVFDEVHALLHDATFIPYTDAIRRRVPEVFANASRIYLSATPQSTLLELRKVETAKKLVHYAFCEKYDYITPVFFHSWTDVAEEINRDKTGSKWLIFLPNIRMADAWRDKLKSDCQILTAQTRSSDPTLWNDLLENECFSSRVLLTTSVIDAGVNFHDKELVNIVSFSLDTEEIIQQVGRKRRTSKQDKVKLYVHEPSRQTVNHRLFRVREMISQLEQTGGTVSPLFVESLLLRETSDTYRNLCYCDQTGNIQVNKLALVQLHQQEQLLQQLCTNGQRHDGDCGFAKIVLRALHISSAQTEQYFLVSERNKAAAAAWDQFIRDLEGRSVPKDEQDALSHEMKKRYTQAFGKRKSDRSDRSWNTTVINRVLREKATGIQLRKEKELWIFESNQTNDTGGITNAKK